MRSDGSEGAGVRRELSTYSEGVNRSFIPREEVAESRAECPPISLMQLRKASSCKAVTPVLDGMERRDSEVEEVDQMSGYGFGLHYYGDCLI